MSQDTLMPQSSAAEQPRMGRKELLAFISTIMAFTAMGIDLMLSAFDEIRSEFGLDPDSALTSRVVTVYMIGLALGQLVYGPLADRFGRKKALYAGALVYVAGAAGAALAPTFGALLAARFIWGAGAAGARVVATAIIRDRFEGASMASAMSNVMAVFVLVPVVAPSVGAGIIAILPWRSVFWFCVLFALGGVAWSLRLKETLNPDNRRELDVRTIVGGYRQVARTPITFGYTMATLFIQAAFVTYLASSELIIANVFDREAQFPIIFGVVAILFGIAAFINGRIVERLGIDRVVNRAFVGIAAALVALVGVTAAGAGEPSFWLFMPIVGLVLAGFMFLMTNLSSAAMVPLGAIAGSGSALTGATRTFGGALLAGLMSERIDDSVVPLVAAIIAMSAFAGATVWLTRKRAAQRV